MKTFLSTCLCCLTFLCALANEKTGFFEGSLDSTQLLILGADGQFLVKNSDGGTLKKIKVGGVIHDLSVLENGHILYANGDHVKEIDLEGNTYFEYIPKNVQGGGVYATERLKNGETLVAENSTGRILFLDPKANIIHAIQTLDYTPKAHHNLRLARSVKNGNVLVCHSGKNLVREYTRTGKVIWSKSTPKTAFKAIRLENGNTLISSLDTLTEYTHSGEIAWQLKCKDFNDFFIQNITGFKLMPNNCLLMGCYHPHEKNNQGQSAILIDKKTKRVLWRYSQPKEVATVMALDLIEKEK